MSGHQASGNRVVELERQRQAVLDYCDDVANELAAPPWPVPPPRWVVHVRNLLGEPSS